MPKHPHVKVTKTSNTGEHDARGLSHGPLKRTGCKAEEWDALIGPSLDTIPGHQLPIVRTIVQRYRALRINDSTESTSNLAKIISVEVKAIWVKACIPTVSDNNCLC